MKFAILDSGPIISLTLNGLLDVLENLAKKFPDTKFIMTPQVKKEVIDKALTIKKYELEALKVQNLLDKKIIFFALDFVKKEQLAKETNRIINLANNVLRADGKDVHILQEGEASCLAFANLCNCKKIIVVDERVARLLTESPENLCAIMERKLHSKVSIDKKNLKWFENFVYIRSSELLYIAYKNNLFDIKKNKTLLDALLYSVKYSGASISGKEIEEMKILAR